jgi:hypothetical protein
MPAVGMVAAWFGWAVGSWGYCLLRGYDIKFTDWINPVHPYSGPWPPPPITQIQLLPSSNPPLKLPKDFKDPFPASAATGTAV